MAPGFEHNRYFERLGYGGAIRLDASVSKNISLQYTVGVGVADKTGIQGHLPLTTILSGVILIGA